MSALAELLAGAPASADDAALQTGDTTVTYGALRSRAGEISQLLERAARSPGAVVIAAGDPSELYATILAAIGSGRPFVIPASPTAEVFDSLAARLGDLAIVDSSDAGELTVRVHEGDAAAGAAWSPDLTAYVGLSSGSIREPRATAVPVAGLAHFVGWARDALGLGAGMRWLELGQASSDMATVNALLTLLTGGTLIVAREQRDLLAPAITIQRTAPTHCRLVPHFLDLMLARRQLTPEHLASLRWYGFGGDVLSSDTVRAARAAMARAEIFGTYGMTETTGFNLWWRAGAQLPEGRLAPLGEPVPGWSARLAPAGEGEDAAELLIASPHAGLGYVGDRVASRERFRVDVEDPSLRVVHTGDLVSRVGPDIFFAGRSDRLVKVNGMAVDLDGVDRVLTEQWQARSASIATERGVVTFVEGELPGERHVLMAAANRLLTPAARPRTLIEIPELPRTPTGKIAWRELAAIAQT